MQKNYGYKQKNGQSVFWSTFANILKDESAHNIIEIVNHLRFYVHVPRHATQSAERTGQIATLAIDNIDNLGSQSFNQSALLGGDTKDITMWMTPNTVVTEEFFSIFKRLMNSLGDGEYQREERRKLMRQSELLDKLHDIFTSLEVKVGRDRAYTLAAMTPHIPPDTLRYTLRQEQGRGDGRTLRDKELATKTGLASMKTVAAQMKHGGRKTRRRKPGRNTRRKRRRVRRTRR